MLMKKTAVLLLVFLLLAGSGAFQAALMEKLLIGRWMLYAGGGEETWDFHEDGTCTTTWYASEEVKTHTWRVEPATAEDREKIWTQPDLVLVIDGETRRGIQFLWDETMDILTGGVISQEERALTASIPLCVSITIGIGGGGYVRMK